MLTCPLWGPDYLRVISPPLGFQDRNDSKMPLEWHEITDRILERFLWNSKWNLEGCCQDSCKNPGRIEQGGFWNYAQYAVRILEFWKDSSDSWRILWSFCKYPASCDDLQTFYKILTESPESFQIPPEASQSPRRILTECCLIPSRIIRILSDS